MFGLLLLLISVLSVLSSEVIFNNRTRQPPDFFIIGAAKCGTTSLHKLLIGHKEICNIGTKELHYFDKPEEYKKGTGFYFQYFNTHCSHYYIDASPSYLCYQNTVPKEIVSTYSPSELKKKRFIVLLRDPVYREYSWYNHLMKACVASMATYMKKHNSSVPSLGWNTSELCTGHCVYVECKSRAKFVKPGEEVKHLITFAEYYEKGLVKLDVGRYVVQLKKWLEYIPRSQIIIINLSTLLEETADTMHRITDFLGISPFPSSVKLPHENAATVETEFDCNTRRALYKHYDPYTATLMKFMHMNETSENAVNQKPPQEPYFEPFKEYRC